MGLSLVRFDGTNITYDIALKIARIRIDAFRHDALQPAYLSYDERLDPAAIPSLIEYEELRKKCDLFERCVYRCSHVIYYKLIANPRLMTYILVDDEEDKILGHAEWSLPTYDNQNLRFELNLKRKLYIFLVDKWFNFLDWLYPTPSLRRRTAEFLWAAELSELVEGKPHTLETMKTYSKEKLRSITYPRELCYFLVLIGIRGDMHGTGLGRQIIHRSMDEIKKMALPPPGVNGPAKIAWQSVHSAKKFYTKLGFHKGNTVISEKGFDHTVFFSNVD